MPAGPASVAAVTRGAAGPGFASATSALRREADLPQLDRDAAETWVYPTNMPVRDYQLAIARTALMEVRGGLVQPAPASSHPAPRRTPSSPSPRASARR